MMKQKTFDMLERIYNRMKNYKIVMDLSVDCHEIANLASDQILISFVEGVYKFDGVEYFLEKIETDSNDRFRLLIACLLLLFEKERALRIINDLRSSQDTSVSESAGNIVWERYSSIEEIMNGHQLVLHEIADKLGIVVT